MVIGETSMDMFDVFFCFMDWLCCRLVLLVRLFSLCISVQGRLFFRGRMQQKYVD